MRLGVRALGRVPEEVEEPPHLERVDELLGLELGEPVLVHQQVAHQRLAAEVADGLTGAELRLELDRQLPQVEVLGDHPDSRW